MGNNDNNNNSDSGSNNYSNNKTISSDSLVVNRARVSFIAKFDRYYADEQNNVFLHFIDIKDRHGNLIKKFLSVPARDSLMLIGNIIIGSTVSFTARLVVDSNCSNGCDFRDIVFQLDDVVDVDSIDDIGTRK